jgi:cytochrome b involved in lipid metabolism
MKLASVLTVATIALLLGAGCSSKTTKTPEDHPAEIIEKQPANTQPSVTITTPEAMPSYSFDEITEHATSTDCWISAHDKVYDATNFVQENPTANAILNECGKDAAASYDNLNQELQQKLSMNEIGSMQK